MPGEPAATSNEQWLAGTVRDLRTARSPGLDNTDSSPAAAASADARGMLSGVGGDWSMALLRSPSSSFAATELLLLGSKRAVDTEEGRRVREAVDRAQRSLEAVRARLEQQQQQQVVVVAADGDDDDVDAEAVAAELQTRTELMYVGLCLVSCFVLPSLFLLLLLLSNFHGER